MLSPQKLQAVSGCPDEGPGEAEAGRCRSVEAEVGCVEVGAVDEDGQLSAELLAARRELARGGGESGEQFLPVLPGHLSGWVAGVVELAAGVAEWTAAEAVAVQVRLDRVEQG